MMMIGRNEKHIRKGKHDDIENGKKWCKEKEGKR